MGRKRKLRIILYGGPWGFMSGKFPMDARFTDRREDLAYRARGEGNAFCFVLEDRDLSTAFAEALGDGRFLKEAQNGRWELRFIPTKKKEQATLAKDQETAQVEIVANYIMAHVPGESSRSEGPGDCAVRLLKKYRAALGEVVRELDVPGEGCPAYDAAEEALG